HFDPAHPVSAAAGPGAFAGASLGVRATSVLALALDARYASFVPDRALLAGTRLRGYTLGALATVHFVPASSFDPVLSAGAGYRQIDIAPPGASEATVFHAVELARVELGLDVRPTPRLALGPFLGAAADLFAFRDPIGAPVAANPAGNGLALYLVAGLTARFDAFGAGAAHAAPTAARLTPAPPPPAAR
ncbi:MAG TPA: hypothetical protein VHB21_15610, partial [Minicystis sp.]|nr:hypothetical protein [Minicystis sp.]